MGLMAERGAQRRGARQTYRTMARMQRRRSFVESRLGTHEDFSSREEPGEAEATAPAPAANEPEYVGELEQLSQRLASSGYSLRSKPNLQAMAAQRADHMSCVDALAEHLGRPTAVLIRQS